MDSTQKLKARKDAKALNKSARIDAALKFHAEYPDFPLTQVASIHNCDPSSINKRLRGTTKSKIIEAQNRQILSPTEEQVLVKWAFQYHQWGLPLRIYHLDQFALEILHRRASDTSPSIGVNWHKSFLKRHDEIKRKLSQPIDRNRLAACTPENLNSFYSLYTEIITTHSIKLRNSWNMDEKGFMIGKCHREIVLVPKDSKTAYIRQDSKREWVSTIKTISADGRSIPPLIIVAGKYAKEHWFHEEEDSAVVISDKGWISKDIGLLWLKQHFEPQTRDPD
jgi:hypothetical protein